MWRAARASSYATQLLQPQSSPRSQPTLKLAPVPTKWQRRRSGKTRRTEIRQQSGTITDTSPHRIPARPGSPLCVCLETPSRLRRKKASLTPSATTKATSIQKQPETTCCKSRILATKHRRKQSATRKSSDAHRGRRPTGGRRKIQYFGFTVDESTYTGSNRKSVSKT